jgi:hypothetical protein
MLIVLLSDPPRGALMRRHVGGTGCGACGRGRTCPRSREARDPTGGHYDPSARSSLDWDRKSRITPGKAKSQEARTWCRCSGRGPAVQNRDGAPKGARALERECGTTEYGRADRRSIPSGFSRGTKRPRKSGAGTTAYPGPPKTRAISFVHMKYFVGQPRA